MVRLFLILLETTNQQILLPLQRNRQVLLRIFILHRHNLTIHRRLFDGKRGDRHNHLRFLLTQKTTRRKYPIVIDANVLSFIGHSRQEIDYGQLLVNLTHPVRLQRHVLKRLLSVLIKLEIGVQIFHPFLVLRSLLNTKLLQVIGLRTKSSAFSIERSHLQLHLFEFELLPHLHTIRSLEGKVEFLEEFFNDLVLHDPIGPPQTSFFSLPRSEGQHMAVLIRIGFPQQSEQWKFEFFPPVLPVIVDSIREELHALPLQQILVLLLQKTHNPSLVPRQSHILASLQLQLHKSPPQKITRQQSLAFVDEPILVTLQEDVVDFRELVSVGGGQIQVRGQSDVIGSDLGEFLNFGGSLDSVYLGYGNLLLLLDLDSPCILDRNGNDETLLVGLEFVKSLLAVDEFEGLGPVIFSAVAHAMINLNKLQIILRLSHLQSTPDTFRSAPSHLASHLGNIGPTYPATHLLPISYTLTHQMLISLQYAQNQYFSTLP